VHAVAEDCLLARGQEFTPLLRRQLKLIGQLVHDRPNADLAFRRGDKHRQHQRLIIWNRHCTLSATNYDP
jgi:hypothetical protein